MVMKCIAGSDLRPASPLEKRTPGVAPERVQLVGFIGDVQQHLACYRQVDIALDTFPYHGTTTTLDSLLMGCR
jgi:predicted O-linked N-acetylglucosamine transferase (SPINDLY family)